MKTKLLLVALAATLFMASSCKSDRKFSIPSPDGALQLSFELSPEGEPLYSLYHKGSLIVKPSPLGFELYEAPALKRNFHIKKTTVSSFDENWEQPWGEQRIVRNNYNELRIELAESEELERKMILVFRLFNDGLGFRYEIPEQPNLDDFLIAEELSYFNLNGDHRCWWLPGDWDISEHLYTVSQFTEIDAISKQNHPNLAQTYIPKNAVLTPITMKTENGLYLSFHEASLIDYAGITLAIDAENNAMYTNLVGSENTPYKVRQKAPFNTPWRTITITQEAGKLIESKLLLNLNEPNKLGDVSWIKPTKYIGIWWEMHLDKSSWGYSNTAGGKPHGRHGATTENTKRYIDFAAANNIGAVLIEGWNTGWENWIGTADREGIFDFVTPYPDYDIAEVVRYAKEKNVRLIMHHETSAAVSTYEQQLDTAYQLMEHFGFDMVKTGYVGTILPKGEYHHNQRMVKHYLDVIKKAAAHKVAVNSHESIMPTGLRRTYPNDISCENLRGQEFNAWASDGGNPPSHLPTVAFTRMLAGPIDYTPGIFNIKIKPYKPNNQINTTLAHQLALYVVIYSPIQMAADLPEYYEGHPAFQFIRDVGVDWEQTIVLNGEIGEYVTIAREERNTGNWFVGSITNEDSRELTIRTNFLDPTKSYRVIVYADGNDAHWDKNPTAYQIMQPAFNPGDDLVLQLAAGGGAAVSFIVVP